MSNPKSLELTTLLRYAQELGLDLNSIRETISDEKKIGELLLADKEQAKRCNVRATPTIFINGQKLVDRSLNGYRTKINSILGL